MAIENQVLLILYNLRTPLLDSFFISITALGSFTFSVVLLALLYLERQRELLSGIFSAYALNILVTYSLKAVINRPRPDVVPKLVEHSVTASFPSGHTSMAFAAAAVLTYSRPDQRKFFITLAVLVAVSRLYMGLHYPTDVLAGALIGSACGVIAVKRNQIRGRLSSVL